MRFKWYAFIIIFFSLFLSSCAHLKEAQELSGGKEHYTAGEFNDAFHQLMPLAVSGNAEAQYAIGYMYYNGYGVKQDMNSALFWINKSADAHYPPAMKALTIIHQYHSGSEGAVPTKSRLSE